MSDWDEDDEWYSMLEQASILPISHGPPISLPLPTHLTHDEKYLIGDGQPTFTTEHIDSRTLLQTPKYSEQHADENGPSNTSWPVSLNAHYIHYTQRPSTIHIKSAPPLSTADPVAAIEQQADVTEYKRPKLFHQDLSPYSTTFDLPSIHITEQVEGPLRQKQPFSSRTVTPEDSKSDVGKPERPSAEFLPPVYSPNVLPRSTALSLVTGVLGSTMYHYQPLEDMEFRLVRVFPERMSKLKCEILHATLTSPPPYIAISYVWGDGVETKPLIIGTATVPVAISLWGALKAVRKRREEVLVWIDALCIDQQNKEEQASQVRCMSHIYSQAKSVAIWLGPHENGSELAMELLKQVSDDTVTPQRIKAIREFQDSAALLALFKRDYWKRLWVVQEVSIARRKTVFCGDSEISWEAYERASDAFWDHDSDHHVRQGPSSLPDISKLQQLGDFSLLEVMRACRKKLCENPRDKVFGILGMLPQQTQREFPVDYKQSVKTVYIDVVDYHISTTDQLDVIRESIHFPVHASSLSLPSWCPDWSHIPDLSGLGRTLNFAASGDTKAQYWFRDERRKLEITGIELDAVKITGVAVGTFCASQDYLMAFVHWRALLLQELDIDVDDETHPLQHAEHAFCRVLALGQIPEDWSTPKSWFNLCYHIFSSMIREKLPRLPMDHALERHIEVKGLVTPSGRRRCLQNYFGNRMMGRSFCITEKGLLGMGSGFMAKGDVVVVPYGCATPILLRPERRHNEFRYVGDVYIDGYMHGEAIRERDAGHPDRVESRYVLC